MQSRMQLIRKKFDMRRKPDERVCRYTLSVCGVKCVFTHADARSVPGDWWIRICKMQHANWNVQLMQIGNGATSCNASRK